MTPAPTPGYAGFARLGWMFLGPMLLLILAFSILNEGGGWFAPRSIAFLGLLAFVVFCRWAEFHAGGATTADGDPATSADIRRYALFAALTGTAIWATANLIALYRGL
jgi:hypothetical protein